MWNENCHYKKKKTRTHVCDWMIYKSKKIENLCDDCHVEFKNDAKLFLIIKMKIKFANNLHRRS